MTGGEAGRTPLLDALLEALPGRLPPELAEAPQALEALLGERQRLERRIDKISRISDGYQAQLLGLNRDLTETNRRLSQALAEVKTLRGLIPICANCKRIRDDRGYWEQIEAYLSRHSEAMFSHGICPPCARELYPEVFPAALGPGPTEPPEDPGEAPEDDEGAALSRRLAELREQPAHADHPLLGELEQLAHRHLRLLRRLDKITRISDGFQRQTKELNGALQEASRTDPLTGLPNRRDMLERLAGELGRSARSGAPVAVLMADVDRFKAVNDTHGHEVGDLVLRSLAESLLANLRVYDSCARWGGEEFLVLLPETGLDAALAVAEKMRAQLADPAPGRERPAPLATVSIGVAVHRPGEPLVALLRRADAALYEAKRLGRNRVEAAPEPG
ncbi:MAG: diguanylate cyclase [Deferrisomatales bacterium]